MNDRDIQTLDQVRAFLEGTEHVEFEVQGKKERYAWTAHTLGRFHYRELARAERGLISPCVIYGPPRVCKGRGRRDMKG